MSRLNYWSRPWVLFDAGNKNHRLWFAQFQKNNTWGRCPVRFIAAENGELLPLMQHQLIEYYINKEFKASNAKHVRSQSKARRKHLAT